MDISKIKIGSTTYEVKDTTSRNITQLLGTASVKDVPTSGNASATQVVMGNDSRLSDSRPASDVSAWAKAANKPTYTKSEIGLDNVTNDAQVKRSEMGAASGVATLDSTGKVPSTQLPSYVDDVIEGYMHGGKFYEESTHQTEITGEGGKIYSDLSTNKIYRWGGSSFAVVSETIAIGTTQGTAYDGKAGYDHVTNTSNPHSVTKSQVGLGNVGNFKAVSTEANQSLTNTEKSNARTNIGAGTSSFSGSYTDLTDKPTIPDAQIQSDWNQTNTSSKDYIKNKPTSMPASDVYSWAKASSKPSYTKSEIGLGNVDNTADSQKSVNYANSAGSAPASDVYSWAKASSKPSYNLDEVSDGSTRKLSDKIGKIINTTWANLKSLRDNSQLIPGQQYRIIDYQCTTTQDNTRSAGHLFDIIVTADSYTALNENARATWHVSGTPNIGSGCYGPVEDFFCYCDLHSWELKYRIDNDNYLFAWADTINGKGVIYWMKDEFDNEADYDFKNIQFKRWKVYDEMGRSGINSKYVSYRSSGYSGMTVPDTNDYKWAYTFSTRLEDAYGNFMDASVIASSLLASMTVLGNVLHSSRYEDITSTTYSIFYTPRVLPNNVFYGSVCYCRIGERSFNNTITHSKYIQIGEWCVGNVISIYSDNIKLEYTCSHNMFDQNCSGITLSKSCINNIFIEGCHDIFVKNSSCNNYFALGASNIYIGNLCNFIRFSKSYNRYIVVHDGNSYITITSDLTTSSSYQLLSIIIMSRTNDVLYESNRKTISHNTVNDSWCTIYQAANSNIVTV